jgi:hypothetical protein
MINPYRFKKYSDSSAGRIITFHFLLARRPHKSRFWPENAEFSIDTFLGGMLIY